MPRQHVRFLEESSEHEFIHIDETEFSPSSESQEDSDIEERPAKPSTSYRKASDSGSDRETQLEKKKSKSRMHASQTQGRFKRHEHTPNDNDSRVTKLLKDTQLKLEQVLSENKNLQKQYADLNVLYLNQTKSGSGEGLMQPSKNSGNSMTKTTRKTSLESALDDDDRIASSARRFGIMNELFMDGSSFLVKHPGCKVYTADRYKTAASTAKGRIAELFREIPEDLHERMISHTSFRDKFLDKLNSNRRSMIYKLRNDIAPFVFKRAKTDYQPATNRSAIPEFVNAIYPRNKSRFSKFAPILYPGREINQDTIFRSEELALVLRGILFGPSSLLDNKPSSKSQGQSWGIKHITPGAIALVSTVVIFLHSSDKVLETVGTSSNIPYSEIFDSYKSILIRNSLNKDPITVELFHFYSSIVFGSVKGKGKDVGIYQEDEESSGVEEAIRKVNRLTIEDDDDSEDRPAEQNWEHNNLPMIPDFEPGPMPRDIPNVIHTSHGSSSHDSDPDHDLSAEGQGYDSESALQQQQIQQHPLGASEPKVKPATKPRVRRSERHGGNTVNASVELDNHDDDDKGPAADIDDIQPKGQPRGRTTGKRGGRGRKRA